MPSRQAIWVMRSTVRHHPQSRVEHNGAVTNRDRLRVMLLFGGQSAEHDVSRVTAVAVARALDPDKYEIVPAGITTEGRGLLAAAAQHLAAIGDRDALPTALEVTA